MSRINRNDSETPGQFIAARFRAKDEKQFFIFRNPYDNKRYTLEILGSESTPLSLFPEGRELIETANLVPDAAAEELRYKITPPMALEKYCMEPEQNIGVYVREDDDGPTAYFVTVGAGTQTEGEREEGVLTASTIKPDKDYDSGWQLVLLE